jgi:uncharacterized protein YidB (DUF937 family)
MGLFDSLEGMATSAISSELSGSGSDTAKVAGGLVQALQEHPGGIPAVLDSLRNSGAPELANGDGQSTTPDQVAAGLDGTGLIESTAEKAGVPPEVAKQVLATVLPMVLAHFAPGGQAPEQSEVSGLAGQLLSKFL